MNLLLIPANYPYDGAEWFGPQNERSALVLKGIVQHVEVLMPRPYAPRLLAAINDRWGGYARIPRMHVRRGIRVHRPAYPVIPGVLRGFWHSQVAFAVSRPVAISLHRVVRFDAILSFDLATTGPLAWRLGGALGIPACGWATGSDIRADPRSRIGRNLQEALRKLDLVFYQSSELRVLGARLLGVAPEALPPEHVVQSRGVMEPETPPGDGVRRSVRAELHLSEDQVVILHLGRVARGKGLFELVDAFAHWANLREDLVLLLVGAIPGRDDAPELDRRIRSLPGLNGRVRILPACPPHRIWEYFEAADIFAFPSYREGMPNALLEAMLGGLPAVAFSIPAVREITRFGKALEEVPAHDFASFGDALLKLAADPARRHEIGESGRAIVREHFSLHKSMRTVVAHLERLAVRRAHA